MANKKYDTILFDMDGTLIDTDPMIFEAFNILYDLYKDGQRKTKEEIYYFSGPPIRQTLAKEFPDQDVEFMFNEFSRVTKPMYLTIVPSFPFVKEVLTELKNEGFKLGVVTNKSHSMTILSLTHLGLIDLFDSIYGLDDLTKGKPDKEGIFRSMNDLRSQKALYVGDNKIDLLTANNAGVDCCLVKWGPRVLPDDVIPTFRITSYLQLKEHLYE